MVWDDDNTVAYKKYTAQDGTIITSSNHGGTIYDYDDYWSTSNNYNTKKYDYYSNNARNLKPLEMTEREALQHKITNLEYQLDCSKRKVNEEKQRYLTCYSNWEEANKSAKQARDQLINERVQVAALSEALSYAIYALAVSYLQQEGVAPIDDLEMQEPTLDIIQESLCFIFDEAEKSIGDGPALSTGQYLIPGEPDKETIKKVQHKRDNHLNFLKKVLKRVSSWSINEEVTRTIMENTSEDHSVYATDMTPAIRTRGYRVSAAMLAREIFCESTEKPTCSYSDRTVELISEYIIYKTINAITERQKTINRDRSSAGATTQSDNQGSSDVGTSDLREDT